MTHCYAVTKLGEIVAYAVFQVIFTEAHLLNIAVQPEFQNHGTGHFLLKDIMRRSQELGAMGFYLEVRPSNEAALHVYEKEGFRKLMVREKYYSNGEDAIVMMVDLI
jgi:ribosomal-protein-alanine N-acetyltransferase